MPEKDGQIALEYILEVLKREGGKANLTNILSYKDKAYNGRYKEADKNAIEEAWLNLFLDGWIMPSGTPSLFIQNWFQTTSYGRSKLEQGGDYYPVFLDPPSTISELTRAIPNIDPLALKYFEEALWAIKKKLFLSATITMGGASESSILSLVDTVIDYYEDTSLTTLFNKNDKIKPKFDLLLTTIKERNLKKELLDIFASEKEKCDDVRSIFINIETTLRRMFDIYRINRNDAGHPSDMGSDPDITRSEAAMFRKYCRIIYGLIFYINEAKRRRTPPP
jgi:hypothetical protein